MRSSGVGPVELITGLTGPVNLLPGILRAGREPVLLMVKLVMAVTAPTALAAPIKLAR